MHKVGIVGAGFVGTAVEVGLGQVPNTDVRIYDKFKDTESLRSVVTHSDILFVCVPTPMEDTGHCDSSIVEEACNQIDRVAKNRKTIVVKSTVPPGTTQEIFDDLEGRHSLLFNPEFLTEANFINDFLQQDRIIYGCAEGSQNTDIVKFVKLFEDFVKTQKEPAFIGELASVEAAEMLKYATNAFLSTKVAFFNEVYQICKAAEIDFNEVRGALLWDKRIGKSHTSVPGPDGELGFGGKCLPKDLNALIALSYDLEIDPFILDAVWTKNLLVRDKLDWEEIPGATSKLLHSDINDE